MHRGHSTFWPPDPAITNLGHIFFDLVHYGRDIQAYSNAGRQYRKMELSQDIGQGLEALRIADALHRLKTLKFTKTRV